MTARVAEASLTAEDRNLVALGVDLIAGGLTSPERFATLVGHGPSASVILNLVTRLAVAKRANHVADVTPQEPGDDALAADVAGWLLAFGLSEPRVVLERLLMPGRGPGKAGDLLVLAEALAAKRRPSLAFSPLT